MSIIPRGRHAGIALAGSFVVLLTAQSALAAGSQSLYPNGAAGFRANTEWRTSTYGGGAVYRRTLLHAYVTAGEHLLMGSSAVGVGAGDIMVWDPGLVTGVEGHETVPATPSFSCAAERTASGIALQGRLTSRAQELAGPDTVPGGTVLNGYTPCDFVAPSTGVYSIAMVGPSGFSSDVDGLPGSDVALTNPADVNATQNTSVSAWDLTVRDSLTDATTTKTGRVFTYMLSLYTAGSGRPVDIVTYPVTPDGFRYRVADRGMDPNGWIQYGTQLGFLDPDGLTPLYHDAVAAATGQPAQLTSIQGGVKFAKPDYPMFFEPPAPDALTALGIPLVASVATISGLGFVGSHTGSISYYQTGGTFSYTATAAGVYQIVISRDGVDFDPTNAANRVLRGLRTAGVQTVVWDGKDNAGGYFPVGTNYAYRVNVHGGEYHLPFVDVENDVQGGPGITLLNPPGGACPPLSGGCSGAFYDDRGYRTSTGATVGTPGAVLCGVAPPAIPFSDPVTGFDTTSSQRAFGTANGGNTNVPCTGSFGDTKGLDIWTYYPSTVASGQLAIIATAGSAPTPAPAAPAAVPHSLGTPSTGASGSLLPVGLGALAVLWGILLVAALTVRRQTMPAYRPPARPAAGDRVVSRARAASLISGRRAGR